MGEPRIDEGWLTARDGVRLFWRASAVDAPVAHVAFLHGYAEHLGRQAEIVRALNEAGYSVHLLDCRGHGQSGGKRAHVDRFQDYLDDLGLFVAQVKRAAGALPVFLVAHSHGALVAARYLIERPDAVRGAVFSSPYFRLKLEVSPLKLLVGRLVAKVLPGLPMRNELQPEQHTRDPAIQAATRADPLYQRIATPGWFDAANAAQDELRRRASEFVTPVLVLAAGADPIADPRAAREFFEGATSPDKQFRQYDGLVHELFHEPERERVFRDVVAWLDERAKGAARVPAPAGSRR